MPSPSKSKPTKSPAQVQVSSNLSATVNGSPSSHAVQGVQTLSHTSPTPFPLPSSWSGLKLDGQLSLLSGIPSKSESVINGVPAQSQLVSNLSSIVFGLPSSQMNPGEQPSKGSHTSPMPSPSESS